MNREIKFRFIKDGKEVFYDIKKLYETEEWTEEQTLEWFGFELIFGTGFSNIKKEQYTGLNDKNGVEIYVGDIVKINVINLALDLDINSMRAPGLLPEALYAEVKWDNKGFWNIYNYNNIKDYEVIGNIYENPEPLEEEK